MRYASLLILPLLLTCCMPYQELPVEYDYSYDGKFKKYKSFDLFIPASEEDKLSKNNEIEQLIINRMEFLGYERNEKKPNLLISYKVYIDSINFNGYNQPDIEYWAVSEEQDLDYNPMKFNLDQGTLLIQLYDRKQNKSIWQGYATTNFGSIVYNDQRSLRNAVLSILDKYRFFADGFEDNFETESLKTLEP